MIVTHRQMDWRKLTVEPHRLPRRRHDRSIYGELRPMDTDDSRPLWTRVVVVLGAVVAVWVVVTQPVGRPLTGQPATHEPSQLRVSALAGGYQAQGAAR